MTLLDIFPSLRATTVPRLDPALWPADTHYDGDGRITLGGVALADLADQYGTPVHVVDEAEVRARCRAYRKYFPDAEIVYAGTALMIGALARWVTEEGLSVQAGSGGELSVALAAGVEPRRVVLHGPGKTCDELRTAVEHGVGRIVVGSLTEISLLAALATRPQQVLLRVDPAIEVPGGPRFGFPLRGTSLATAVARIAGQPNLRLVGLHCHLGAQISNPDLYGEAIRRLIGEMAWIDAEYGLLLSHLDIGGGHAVAVRGGDAELNLPEFADIVEDALDAGCARHRFPRPVLVLEPGRGIVARAGVSLHRVLAVTETADGGTTVLVDGAGACPARGSAVLVNRHPTGARLTASILGSHGGSGIPLAADVRLPADLRPGEVLALPCAGAYHPGLVSTYRGVGRPPVVAVAAGRCTPLLRRETTADLLRRETAV
ncbi:diaminopimelate decarboxylase [Nocardia asteroides NBRC 15531]|uniref:Diaminopimelate decarboxylase n=1 Tax=Nocardia asteroides NBRC 15531 TaxID=1110697 RepID=U5EI83_NOCAS|nr:alanine racemase [Nocardia asteroides]TLF63317.1 diaminopimelate decarboxylase [Nocardia asteroides NBRC 15531]UGT47265.1 alanine racemase [Nocardia asteroides]SFM74400.1 diaminopimelate decarboxylase [Nocardia asteroides]VEG33846.1 Diaminopimelate decarboxylase [Nocardia asteroides]GAD87005.1 diaminopimelate decarboxylase [Nocardia asteroides NBRC 15531]